MQNRTTYLAVLCNVEGKEAAKCLVDRPEDNIEVNPKINMLIPAYITVRHNKILFHNINKCYM